MDKWVKAGVTGTFLCFFTAFGQLYLQYRGGTADSWENAGWRMNIPVVLFFAAVVLMLVTAAIYKGIWIPPKQQHTATASEPKLKIHRANYGAGPHAEVSVHLQNAVRDAIVIHVDPTLGGLLPRDPAPGACKRLDVDYSYEGETILHLSRLEPEAGQTMRLVLPEDTEVSRLQSELREVQNVMQGKLDKCEEEKEALAQKLAVLVKSTTEATPNDPRVYVSIEQRDKATTPFIVSNRGGSEARNVQLNFPSLSQLVAVEPLDVIQSNQNLQTFPELQQARWPEDKHNIFAAFETTSFKSEEDSAAGIMQFDLLITYENYDRTRRFTVPATVIYRITEAAMKRNGLSLRRERPIVEITHGDCRVSVV